MSTATTGNTRRLELSAPVKLTDAHDLSEFRSGVASIDDFLVKRAWKSQLTKMSVTYVTCFKDTNVVAGYYTLSNGSTLREDVVPAKNQRNSPGVHPVTILGRLGISQIAQGQGFAKNLVKDAIKRSMAASDIVGSSAVVVHPLTSELVEFYRKFGFVECYTLTPVSMMLSLI